MKKLSLASLSLSESNVLSPEEKRISQGGYMGCGTDNSGFVWQQCQSGICVRDLSECPDGPGPCIDGSPLPSGNCVDP